MTPQLSQIAHYRITSKLGEGGMGAVYRATDTKLNREVAIKVLPDSFAAAPDRLARFTREAQVLASLNHPNIAAIYGVEDRALVMELVEGETLQGPLPLDTALDYARQIGEALEAAHEKGIVHRDLKPANIKVTPEGRVKVLDFGLAKAMSEDTQAPANSANSPTLTMRATMAGIIMGTAGYMSPEQARGKAVDKRADIWAFGVVLYEMLTGERLFDGETVSDSLAAVLTREPDLGRVPVRVRRLLQSCLEKEPRKRLRDVGDAWRQLEEAPAVVAPVPRAKSSRWPWIAFAVAAAAAGAVSLMHFNERPTPAPVVRFTISPPDKGQFGAWLALSPDGKYLAFPARGEDLRIRLWLRSLDSPELKPIAGTDGASNSAVFWSHDNRTLVFQWQGKLRKVDIAGGPPQTLCDAPQTVLGGVWTADGAILFGTNNTGIQRVPASGGTPIAVTRVDAARRETFHTDPILLPDGRHFLYFRHSTLAENQGLYVGSLDAKPEEQNLRQILAIGFSPAYAPPRRRGEHGRLLFLREGTLMAQTFDAGRFELTGDATPLVPQVGSSLSRSFVSVSPSGTLAWRSGGTAVTQFEWLDRDGHAVGRIGEPGYNTDVALSPDGARLAYSRAAPGESTRQVWVVDVARGIQTRLTFLPQGAWSPAWSPDGRYLAYSGSNTRGVWVQESTAGNEPRELNAGVTATVSQWSPDGRYIIYTSALKGYDVLAMPSPLAPGEVKAIAPADSPFNEFHGQVSADARWIAYNSDESGRPEIYVRPFPPGDGRSGRWLISSGGGIQPRWRRDGRELYYIEGQKVMAVDVKSSGSAFEAATPHALFSSPAIFGAGATFQYDVTADGKKFVVVTPAENAASSPIVVTLNWEAGLKQ
jgi:Tol biopolymer transport system component/predicted Ser/Thr protein kinase